MLKYANFYFDSNNANSWIFNEINGEHCVISGPFSVIDEHFGTVLPNSFDAIGLMLMIRIIHQHQVYS